MRSHIEIRPIYGLQNSGQKETLEAIKSLTSSMPNEDDMERFNEFFMKGSHNLKKFDSEYDDIGRHKSPDASM